MPDAVDRRRANNFALIALVVTLMTNVIALVWGAATLNATVGNLANSMDTQAGVLSSVVSQVNQLNNRMGIVEDRSNRSARQLDKQ